MTWRNCEIMSEDDFLIQVYDVCGDIWRFLGLGFDFCSFILVIMIPCNST